MTQSRKRRPIEAGEVFSRLTVIAQADPMINRRGFPVFRVLAKCECGTEVIVYESKLRYGSTRSCGCLKKEASRNNLPAAKHGMAGSPTHISWRAMKDRCQYPGTNGYERYGGAGITVCERWQVFENFLADMGMRPEGKTIDRIDSRGNYEPGNCKWSTWREQESNRSDNRYVELAGEQVCFTEAARLLSVGIDRLKYQSEILGGDQNAVNSILKEILTAAA